MTKQKYQIDHTVCVFLGSYFLQEALYPRQFQDAPSWAANYFYKKKCSLKFKCQALKPGYTQGNYKKKTYEKKCRPKCKKY